MDKAVEYVSESFDKDFLKEQLKDWKSFMLGKYGLLCILPSLVTAVLLTALYVYDCKDGALTNKLVFSIGSMDVHTRTLLSKAGLEQIAIVLMSITTGTFLLALIKSKSEFIKILTVLAGAFLCREIHFAGTHKGIYIAVTFILIWTALWNERVFSELRADNKLRILVTMTGCTYIFAILIQRRFFKRVVPAVLKPYEQLAHVAFEEYAENVAHFCFFACALYLLITSLRKKKEL